MCARTGKAAQVPDIFDIRNKKRVKVPLLKKRADAPQPAFDIGSFSYVEISFMAFDAALRSRYLAFPKLALPSSTKAM